MKNITNTIRENSIQQQKVVLGVRFPRFLTGTVHLVDIFFKNIWQGLAKLQVFASHASLANKI